MENIFTKNDVIQIIPDSTTVDMGNAKISLKNHVQMTGQNETFLYETSYDGIEEKVEKVFSIEGRKQKELSKKNLRDIISIWTFLLNIQRLIMKFLPTTCMGR